MTWIWNPIVSLVVGLVGVAVGWKAAKRADGAGTADWTVEPIDPDPNFGFLMFELTNVGERSGLNVRVRPLRFAPLRTERRTLPRELIRFAPIERIHPGRCAEIILNCNSEAWGWAFNSKPRYVVVTWRSAAGWQHRQVHPVHMNAPRRLRMPTAGAASVDELVGDD